MPPAKHHWVNRKVVTKRDDGTKHTAEWIECDACGKRPENSLMKECNK